jgi:hypothetical protein
MAATPERFPRLLSTGEVAARLDCSNRRVRTIPPAELPYLVLADRGVRRYLPADVDLYLRRRTVRL